MIQTVNSELTAKELYSLPIEHGYMILAENTYRQLGVTQVLMPIRMGRLSSVPADRHIVTSIHRETMEKTNNNQSRVISFDECFTYKNLFEAHIRARSNKRYKEEVIAFDSDAYYEIDILQRELQSGQYRISEYSTFTIFDPKKRQIHAPQYRDRVVQHCLCDNIIKPTLERRLIFDNAASREGKGTHFAIKRLNGFMLDYYRKYGNKGYILKCDISKYFDSIDHTVLYEKLISLRAFDKKTMWLLREILDSYNTTEGKGIPLGNQSSQWFALLYLDSLDRLVKEKLRLKYYSRYMDDCVILHNDKKLLKSYLEQMKIHIESELGLRFNSKTQIMPMSQGVDYLGFRFYLTDTGKVIRRLRTSNKKRMKRKLKKQAQLYSEGMLELETIKRSLAGYKGHLKHGHTYNLRKRLSQEIVLMRKV